MSEIGDAVQILNAAINGGQIFFNAGIKITEDTVKLLAYFLKMLSRCGGKAWEAWKDREFKDVKGATNITNLLERHQEGTTMLNIDNLLQNKSLDELLKKEAEYGLNNNNGTVTIKRKGVMQTLTETEYLDKRRMEVMAELGRKADVMGLLFTPLDDLNYHDDAKQIMIGNNDIEKWLQLGIIMNLNIRKMSPEEYVDDAKEFQSPLSTMSEQHARAEKIEITNFSEEQLREVFNQEEDKGKETIYCNIGSRYSYTDGKETNDNKTDDNKNRQSKCDELCGDRILQITRKDKDEISYQLYTYSEGNLIEKETKGDSFKELSELLRSDEIAKVFGITEEYQHEGSPEMKDIHKVRLLISKEYDLESAQKNINADNKIREEAKDMPSIDKTEVKEEDIVKKVKEEKKEEYKRREAEIPRREFLCTSFSVQKKTDKEDICCITLKASPEQSMTLTLHPNILTDMVGDEMEDFQKKIGNLSKEPVMIRFKNRGFLKEEENFNQLVHSEKLHVEISDGITTFPVKDFKEFHCAMKGAEEHARQLQAKKLGEKFTESIQEVPETFLGSINTQRR